MPTSPSPTATHSPLAILRPASAAMIVANSGTVATITAAVPVSTVRIPNASIPLDSPTSSVPTIAALRISAPVGQIGFLRAAKMKSPMPAKRLRNPTASAAETTRATSARPYRSSPRRYRRQRARARRGPSASAAGGTESGREN